MEKEMGGGEQDEWDGKAEKEKERRKKRDELRGKE